MNVVLDDAEELDMKRKTRKPIGRIMLKGDNITLMCAAPAPPKAAGEVSGGTEVPPSAPEPVEIDASAT